jgi:hypothetical protein
MEVSILRYLSSGIMSCNFIYEKMLFSSGIMSLAFLCRRKDALFTRGKKLFSQITNGLTSKLFRQGSDYIHLIGQQFMTDTLFFIQTFHSIPPIIPQRFLTLLILLPSKSRWSYASSFQFLHPFFQLCSSLLFVHPHQPCPFAE